MIAKTCPIYLTMLSLANCIFETNAGFATSIDRLREECRMKDLATRLDQKEGTKFWSEAVKFSLDKCTPDFAIELRDYVGSIGSDHSDKQQLDNFIKEQTMRGCCEKFAPKVEKWNQLQASIMNLHRFASFYKLDEHEEADVIWRVSDLMKAISPTMITSLDDFEDLYRSDSPCAEFYASIRQDDELIDYLHFLRLAGNPDYFWRVTEQHENNVHVMALCDHIDRAENMMSIAYYVYHQ